MNHEANVNSDERAYIRHPLDLPIEVEVIAEHQLVAVRANNLSVGGLAFFSESEVEAGRVVKLSIHNVKPTFSVTGFVQWCRPSTPHGHEVGVQFADSEDAFRVRMVEQVCHIESYRQYVLEHEGRVLTGESAATEWIQKFAQDFPNPIDPNSL